MRVSLITIILVFTSSAAIADPQAKPPADAPTTLVLAPHTFNDPASANMPSHTVLVPKGWKSEGGAFWPGAKIFRIHPSQHITVTAPDGRLVIVGPSFGATDMFPSQHAIQNLGARRPAEGQVENGTPVLYMPQNAQQWAQWIRTKAIAATYQGAEDIVVHSVDIVPELTQLMHQKMQPIVQQQAQQNQQAAQFGLNQKAWCDGSVLAAKCSYTHNGKKWDQLYVWGVSIIGLDQQVGRQIWWSVEPNVGFRAPAGELDKSMPLLISIATSVRMTPQWAKMKFDHLAKMAAIDRKGAADRAAIIAKSNREIRQIITKGHADRQAIRDKGHHQYIQSIREVNEYTVPGSNQTVELPHHYNHVYTNSNGEYILTNDANYNPNTDSNVNNQNWETMKTVE